MSEGEDRFIDTRQLEKDKLRWQHIPGEVRFFYLGVPDETWVLTAWHKNIGDVVKCGEVLLSAEAAFATVESEVYEAGVMVEQFFSVGETIPDGAVVARVAEKISAPHP